MSILWENPEKVNVDGQKHLSGQLADWSIDDLLRIMEVTKKTGSLRISGSKNGRIHFRDGKVTGADLDNNRHVEPTSDDVADAVFVLSTAASGSFALGEDDGPDGAGWGVDEVLEAVATLGEIENEVAETGMIEASGIRLADKIDDEITLGPDHWQALVCLVQPFTFPNLEARLGRGGAVRVLHALNQLGVAEAVTVEEETEWLDRVADGVSSPSSEPTWLEAQSTVEDQVDESADVETEADEATDTEEPEPEPKSEPAVIKGVSAPASTTLTDGVYDEIRRLRSKAADK